MAASLTDKITDVRNSARPNSTTVTVARAPAATNLTCNSLTGWPTASKVHFVTYQTDTNNDVIAGTQLDCYGIVSGNTITNMVVLDGTDGGNSVGDKVEMLPTAGWGQDLADGLMVSHNRDGSLADDAVTTDVIANLAVTTAKINDLAVTNGKLAAGSVTSDKLVGYDKSGLTFDYNPYKFSVYRNGNYTHSNAAQVQYNAESFDTNNNFNTSTYKYTVPVNGFYQHNMAVTFSISGNSNTGYSIQFYKNSGEGIAQGERNVNMYAGGYTTTVTMSYFGQFTAGDTLYVGADCSTTNTVAGTSFYTWWNGYLISRT